MLAGNAFPCGSIFDMNILGISRSPRFSPNSANRDSAIFAAVASRMQRGGNDVSVISEDLFISVDLSEFDLVFSMARGHDVLEALAEAEKELPLRVVNSARALLEATRHRLVRKLEDHRLPRPVTQVLCLDADGTPSEDCKLSFPLWLKRGDACAQQATDVCHLESAPQLREALQGFARNGVHTVIAEEHVAGDLVKFYGVEGTDFFFHAYPAEGEAFSKFGLERYNGPLSYIPFDAEELKRVADSAARATGFTVYGGDAVVRPDGTFVLIDFNDWPSFSSCRKEAAKAIVQRLNKQ